MPAGSPAFKQDQRVSDPEDRYAMTVLATAANAAFYASRFEIDRPGITYTVDTLGDLRSHYPDNVELLLHHRGGRHHGYPLRLARRRAPGVSPRSSRPRAPDMTSIRRRPASPPPESISTCATSRFPRSPSARRAFAIGRRGKSPRYLTSESVMGYIHKNGLYLREGE